MIKTHMLTAAIRNAIVYAVTPAAAVVALTVHADEDVTQMETITVTAQALKVETPAAETPKSVSIVSEDELRQRAPQKLDEALRYTSGVTAQPYGADNDTDWIGIRGFEAATYLDGNRLFRDGYYTWLLEPYGLEAVEVIKGPSAILYGESAPGGIVNAVQKKPSSAQSNELRLELGNKNHQAVAVDASGDANDDGSVRYRLVSKFRSTDGELDHTETDRIYLAPSLEIDVSEKTELTLLATYLQDDGIPTNPFFPIYGTLLESDFGKIDPSTNYGEPDYDKYERTQISFGYQLKHYLNDTWTLNQNFNYGYNELFLRSVYAFTNYTPDSDQLYRGVVFRDGKNQSLAFDNNAVANWFTDSAEHTVLTGLDLQYSKTEGAEQDNYGFSQIDAMNPVYGNYTPLDPANNVDREINKSQVGLYSQYNLNFQQRWIANIGARYDWVSVDNKNLTSSTKDSVDESQLSMNLGLMYLADNGLSPYISYSESFEVLGTIDPVTKKPYKPLEGEQYELGVKYTPSIIDGYINVALFDITQKNALQTQGSLTTQSGETHSEGFEVEAVSKVTDTVKVSASYTYNSVKTNVTNSNEFKQAAVYPKHLATLWLDYDAYSLVDGLTIASGLRYIGESKDSPDNTAATVPGVTLWDAAATYDITSQWQAQLNINNLLDKEYVSVCNYNCYYGQSRTVMLNANYRW
ncbi:ligand-gated channel [Vibrio galatheae]|uniref:Ligand-gated channel n=1 Tax=Vibrio galatheae TaxID=579748 RepID=A0A0F4NND2_9VIBR|nr:TonB-dependent siderophore receptor [Vibrio galatheae]KJY84374.1 ligand-gated channel [Vibrio galatheae]